MSDSFGQMFLLKVPKRDDTPKTFCKLVVTFLKRPTNVAVWNGSVLVGQTVDGTARYYDCVESANSLTTIYIYADTDVSVNVYFQSDARTIGDPLDILQSYVVYPTDTYGTEIRTVYDTKAYCYPMSSYSNVNATILFEKNAIVKVSNQIVRSGHSFQIEEDTVISTESPTYPEVIYYFSQPATLFCISSEDHTVLQYMPFSSWSTHYKVPTYSGGMTDISFEIHILASSDNTEVNITPGRVHISLDRRGQYHVVNTSQYSNKESLDIKSTSPVAVGLAIKHHNLVRSFLMIPPVTGLIQNGLFISVPISPIRDMLVPTSMHIFRTRESGVASYFNHSITSPLSMKTALIDGGPSYGFSILRDDKNKTLVVPGYAQFKTFQVSHRKFHNSLFFYFFYSSIVT